MKAEYKLELIVGPMYAGKSEELIRRIRRWTYAKQEVVLFKPTIDNRYDQDYVVTHSKDKFPAQNIVNVNEIYDFLQKHKTINVIGIDEVQFLEGDVINCLNDLANQGYHIIASGLNQDFRGEPFGFMPKLMAISDQVDTITAICLVCGREATKSQRLINNKPAKYKDDVIMLGAQESYEARCRKHHKCEK